MLSPRTGASLESVTDLASIHFTSPKMHRAIGQPSCSSRQCQAHAIQTEAEELVSKNMRQHKELLFRAGLKKSKLLSRYQEGSSSGSR